MTNTSQLENEQSEESKTVLDDLGISALFRCDSCSSKAYAAATKGDLMLLFCGHHARKFEPGLLAAEWDIEDCTHHLRPLDIGTRRR